MIFQNVVVDIYRMSSEDVTDKARTLFAESISILLVPANNDTASFYPDIPVGQLHEFLVTNQIDDIRQDDILKVVNAGDSVYEVDQEFIVSGKSRRTIMLGNRIIQGVCVEK